MREYQRAPFPFVEEINRRHACRRQPFQARPRRLSAENPAPAISSCMAQVDTSFKGSFARPSGVPAGSDACGRRRRQAAAGSHRRSILRDTSAHFGTSRWSRHAEVTPAGEKLCHKISGDLAASRRRVEENPGSPARIDDMTLRAEKRRRILARSTRSEGSKSPLKSQRVGGGA